MSLLQDKVVIVTGGAQSMGANHVRRCVEHGAFVVFGDIDEPRGKALAESIGERAHFQRQDVTSAEDWGEILRVAEHRFGGVDVLVNNAAIHANCLLEEESAEVLRHFLEVNTIGTFRGAKAVVPYMKKRGGGSIINISSLAGIRGIPGYTAYGATKWAVRGMTQVWANELGPDNIRVNAIMPGAIAGTGMFTPDNDSEIFQRVLANIPLRRAGVADNISDLIVFLSSDQSSYMTGTEQLVDGGRAVW